MCCRCIGRAKFMRTMRCGETGLKICPPVTKVRPKPGLGWPELRWKTMGLAGRTMVSTYILWKIHLIVEVNGKTQAQKTDTANRMEAASATCQEND